MPRLKFRPALQGIKEAYLENEELQNPQVPAVLGGEVDMLLGIGYNKVYLEVVFTLPSGLQILKSRFLPVPARTGEVCCVGGPLGAAQCLINNIGAQATMSYLAHLMSGYNNYKSKVDYYSSY